MGRKESNQTNKQYIAIEIFDALFLEENVALMYDELRTLIQEGLFLRLFYDCVTGNINFICFTSLL